MTIDRIRALPCWQGATAAEILKGGLSNESWKVTDEAGTHVVRFGVDFWAAEEEGGLNPINRVTQPARIATPVPSWSVLHSWPN